MGNICSSCGPTDPDTNEQLAPANAPGGEVSWRYPDFTLEPKTSQPFNEPPSYELVIQQGGAPSHKQPSHEQSSPNALQKITEIACNCKMYGIKGAFDVLVQRHFELHIDTTYTLRPTTRKAILLVALYVLGNAKARDSNTSFYFTSYPNTKSPSLESTERSNIKALVRLWRQENYRTSCEMVENDPVLRDDLGYGEWLARSSQLETDATDKDRHIKILNHTRQMMIPLWRGWHQRDLTLESFEKLFNTAIVASSKQPMSLNSVRVTYEKSIAPYMRHIGALESNSAKEAPPTMAVPPATEVLPTAELPPTTIIMLIGSPLQPSEVQAIKNCQRENSTVAAEMAKKRKVKEKNTAVGIGTQFQIFTLLLTDHLDQRSISLYKDIDDFAQGEHDINDLLPVSESEVLRKFLSPKALLKMFNSHHPEVDNMQLHKPEDIYSHFQLVNGANEGLRIILPTVKQLMEIHGIEDLSKLQVIEDSDDEEHGLSQAQVTNYSPAVEVFTTPEGTN